jgi:hypothetical protein
MAKRRGVTEAEVIRRAVQLAELEASAEEAERDAAWARLLDLIRRRAEVLPKSEGGRSWTRDELHDDRPRYVSG